MQASAKNREISFKNSIKASTAVDKKRVQAKLNQGNFCLVLRYVNANK